MDMAASIGFIVHLQIIVCQVVRMENMTAAPAGDQLVIRPDQEVNVSLTTNRTALRLRHPIRVHNLAPMSPKECPCRTNGRGMVLFVFVNYFFFAGCCGCCPGCSAFGSKN